MRAVILAAGRGTRMKSLTDEKPKCLVELHGKALLDWQLEALRAAGVSDIAIVTGYKREMLANKGLTEFHNARWAETNMVSSLACAGSWLEPGPCIVSYSDIFYGSSAVKSLIKCSSLLAVTYDPNWLELWTRRFGDPLLDAETFRLAGNQSLYEIGKKPKSVDEIQGQYMGLMRLTPKGWAEIKQICSSLPPIERDKIHMTGILQKIICAKRLDVMAVRYDGRWGEIDSNEDLGIY